LILVHRLYISEIKTYNVLFESRYRNLPAIAGITPSYSHIPGLSETRVQNRFTYQKVDSTPLPTSSQLFIEFTKVSVF
jgi:hypothetical protein